jgi:hypothetical protein
MRNIQKRERENNNNNRARDSGERGDDRTHEDRASGFPSDPNPYGPTQPFRRMHLIQQRRQTTQLLFAEVRTAMRASAGDPVAVGSNGGSRSFRVPLEVSFESLTRVVERSPLVGRVGHEGHSGCPRGHRTRESDRIVHVAAAR